MHAICSFSGAFEHLENRVQVEPRSAQAPSEIHKPDNFITFVSSLKNGSDRCHRLSRKSGENCSLILPPLPTKQHRERRAAS